MELNLPEGKYLVAVSGGADSVALLCLFADTGVPVTALHCNFQLRGEESDRDERFVRRLCQRLQIPLEVKHFETAASAKEKKISLEMAARELRYEWFEQMRQQWRADYIAVAHHRDDQAETVLLNLLRGTGLQGLAGMKPVNGTIVRPLLNYGHQEILDYLKERGQDYVTDSTNLERNALRNRIRMDVIPLLKTINPRAVEHIATTAQYVAEATAEHAEDSQQALHEWLHPLGFTSAQEKEIWRNRRSGAVWESPTHRLLRDREGFILEEKSKALVQPEIVQTNVTTSEPLNYVKSQPLSADYAYLDADLLQPQLTLRHPQTADRFCPYGMKGSRLVSDFLTDLKLSRFEKEQQWLLCSGDDIVWVVGRRSDHRFRVTETTQRVCCLHVKP
ncbi:MAG: tRNA lysidine(34) synthetase TilS [Bacteroidaceae bacterium]|nr:tRNA lysidine(34) synthetase TilS [Bacteroidaceae bacterium]